MNKLKLFSRGQGLSIIHHITWNSNRGSLIDYFPVIWRYQLLQRTFISFFLSAEVLYPLAGFRHIKPQKLSPITRLLRNQVGYKFDKFTESEKEGIGQEWNSNVTRTSSSFLSVWLRTNPSLTCGEGGVIPLLLHLQTIFLFNWPLWHVPHACGYEP